MKLVSNATTLVSTALFGVSIHEGASDPELRDLMLRSGQEALDIGQALGHPILPIFGLTDADVAHSNRVVELLLETLLKGFTLPSTKTTVLQDWMKGRHSEVSDLNGTVVDAAKRLGLNAPVNAAIVEMALEIESGRVKPLPSNIRKLAERVRELGRGGAPGAALASANRRTSRREGDINTTWRTNRPRTAGAEGIRTQLTPSSVSRARREHRHPQGVEIQEEHPP